jgi:hypothetical protein
MSPDFSTVCKHAWAEALLTLIFTAENLFLAGVPGSRHILTNAPPSVNKRSFFDLLSIGRAKAFHAKAQSRQGAKKTNHLFFLSLRALVSLREIVYSFIASYASGRHGILPQEGRDNRRRGLADE